MSQIARLIYRAAVALRGETGVFRQLRALERLERLSSEHLRAFQETRLQLLLHHAACQVPYYRRQSSLHRYKHVASAFDQLLEWPVVDKSEIMQDMDDRIAKVRSRIHTKSTGGSTGMPVRIIKDAPGIAMERAATLLGLGWYGIRFGDRVARLWGTPVTVQGQRKARYADRAMNRLTISVFDIDDNNLERIWDTLVASNPRWIYGYADALHRLSLWTVANGRDVSALRAQLIVSTGEPISEQVENDIRSSLQTPVQNEYGCGEVGAIAYECRSGSLHIMAANTFIEILRPDGTRADLGEMGEVVVTDLTNYAQPLIRYRLGDRSSLLPPCNCGLPWPTIQRVEGRAMDLILTPAGRCVYGAFITYHMRRISSDGVNFQQYQFVQLDRSTVEVRVCCVDDLPTATTEELINFGCKFLDGMEVKIRRVPHIERERSGKLRIVKNYLDQSSLSRLVP